MDSDRESILTATTSDVSYAAARNIYYTTSGRMLSIQDIAYIHGMNWQTLQLSDDSCENIMEYMSKKGFHYVSLIHREVDRTKGSWPGVTPGHESFASGVTPGRNNQGPRPGVTPGH